MTVVSVIIRSVHLRVHIHNIDLALVLLQSCNNTFLCLPSYSEVMVSLKKKEFTISESEAARWLSVYVCVNLSGELTRPVTVELSTRAGTADGMTLITQVN